MRIHALRLTLLSALCCLAAMLTAQNSFLGPLVDHADRFNRVLPQETVYLHLDNTGYFVDETIWFKAYVTQSDGDVLTLKSKVLYVELVDQLGEVVDKRIVKLENGQGHGDIRLMKHLRSGYYEVRAYTRYMLNFDPRGIFSRVIPVFSAPKNEADYSQLTITELTEDLLKTAQRTQPAGDRRRVNVDFYPEGGHLVVGKENRVAFDVYDHEGRHLAADGVLLHGRDTLLTTQCDSMGRGTFTFTPTSGVYRLVVKADGHKGEGTLPVPLMSGCALQVEAGRQAVDVKVAPTADMVGMKLGMLVSHHGQVEVCDSFVVDSATQVFHIDNKLLADGVNSVTVFSASGSILAERRFFVYPRTTLSSIGIRVENPTLVPYDSVTIVAETGHPFTTFSLAVHDASTEVQGSSVDAATWFLLSSDLRGHVEHPRYYLEADDYAHRQATDLLMLVQGWRKYDFEQMNGLSLPTLKHPAEQNLLLMGRLYPRRKKDAVANVELGVVLMNQDRDVVTGTTTTDEKGYYTFNVPDCQGTWVLVMRTSIEDKNKDYYVGIDRNFSPVAKAIHPDELARRPVDRPRFWLEQGVLQPRVQQFNNRMLKAVTVKGTWKKRLPWESSAYGATTAELKYDCLVAVDKMADRGEAMPTLYEWLKTQNPLFVGGDIVSGESSYRKQKYNFHDDGPSYDNRPVLWYLDNRFMFGTGMSPQLVKKVPASEQGNYTPKVFPASLDDCAQVYISTHLGARELQDVNRLGLAQNHCVFVYAYSPSYRWGKYKGMRRTFFDGYSVPATFSCNNYHVLPPEADFRRTLYWAPDVTTDADGKAKVGFFNSSACRQFIISAEGVTQSGVVMVY